MRKFNIAAVAAAALMLGTSSAQAQSHQSTQTVSFEVVAINSIVVSGTPSLQIVAANAGSAPTSVTASGTYAVTTNEELQKITAQLGEAMPDGLTLAVLLGAPSGAQSSSVDLDATAQDVVTGISTLNASGLSIGYTLSATSAAGVVPADSRVVTYTIIADA